MGNKFNTEEEYDEYVRNNQPTLDILDKLENEIGFVRIVLSSGAIVYGKPDCIVYDEDEEGFDTIKTIRFEPYTNQTAIYYKKEDISSYEQCDEEDIPPSE